MNVLRTPLTALAVAGKFNQNGRHVGLDFYDLLIEAGDTPRTIPGRQHLADILDLLRSLFGCGVPN